MKFYLIIFLLLINVAYANDELPKAITQSIAIDHLASFKEYPEKTQQLILKAQALTQQNLTYQYGSADPKKGGMDCSGTIYYLLKSMNISDVPRPGNEMYLWVSQKGKLHTVSSNSFDSAEFSHLKPGDLLFWSGTYNTQRQPPITHVMLYLGKNKQGQPLMFGASDGRTYQEKSMWGVSLFDFKLPNPKSSSRFVGYSCIPHLTCEYVKTKGSSLEK